MSMPFQYGVERREQGYFLRTGEGDLPIQVRDQEGYVTYKGIEFLTHIRWQNELTQTKGICYLGPVPSHIAHPSAPSSSVSVQQLSAPANTTEEVPLQLPPPLEPQTLRLFASPPQPPPKPAVLPSSPQPPHLSSADALPRSLSPVLEEAPAPAPSFLARMARPLDRTLLPTKLDKVITAILGFPGALIGGLIGLVVGLISAPFTKVVLKQSVKDGMLSFAQWGSLLAPPFLGAIFAGGLFLLNKCRHTPTTEENQKAAQSRGSAWALGRGCSGVATPSV